MNKKDLAMGVKQMRSVAKLLTKWADDLEASAGADGSALVAGSDAAAAPASDSGTVAGAAPGAGVDSCVAPAACAPAPKLPELRKLLAEKCAAGYSAQVKAAIASFGATSLSGVPEGKYGELKALADRIGGDTHAG